MKHNFQKSKVVTGKIPFFVISRFCTPHSFALLLGSDRAALHGNIVFLIFVLSTNIRYSSSFQKVCFKVGALKTFKILQRFSQKNMLISQTDCYFEKRSYAILVVFKMKPPKKLFYCVKRKTNSIFAAKVVERSNSLLSDCLMNHLFQTSILFNAW